jgi:hypothetical protein
MPDEIVPDHLHVAIEAELHVSIRRVECVAVGRRLRRLKLQDVLRADLVELLRDDVDGGGIYAVKLPLVDRDAYHHPLRHQVLQRHILMCRHRQNGKRGARDNRARQDGRSHGAEHCMTRSLWTDDGGIIDARRGRRLQPADFMVVRRQRP